MVSRKILVIANDSTVALSCEQALSPAGYTVLFFDHPAAGVRAAMAGGFDAILVGQTAPELKPLEVLRQIKAARVGTKVVIVSRDATLAAAVAAMKGGAADYLRDPCSAEELRLALERFADSPRRILLLPRPRRTNRSGPRASRGCSPAVRRCGRSSP